MEKKYISNEYTETHANAKAAFISEETQKILDEYIATEDVNLLYKIIDEKPAHVIDVIYKESIKTYNDNNKNVFKIMQGIVYFTEYEKFDKDKVFFNENIIDGIKDDYMNDPWHYPITIYTDKNNLRSNFISHNYFYEPDLFDYSIDNNLLVNFYQNIDISCSENYFKQDLITALYRVVIAAYWYWEQEIDIIKKTEEWMNNNKNIFITNKC